MLDYTLVLCLHSAAALDNISVRLRRSRGLLAGASGQHLLLVGHGPPDRNDGLRQLAAEWPRCRLLLHARRCSSAQALQGAIPQVTTPWVLLLSESTMDETRQMHAAKQLLTRARELGAATACVADRCGDVILFRADAFLSLPGRPVRASCLPECFARAGLGCQLLPDESPRRWSIHRLRRRAHHAWCAALPLLHALTRNR